jgi:hypothetical protein
VSSASAAELPKPGIFRSPDQDKLQLSLSPGQEDSITFCLSTTRGISWWKGVKLFGGQGPTLGLLATTDNDHGPSCRTIPLSEWVEGESKLELWKAKAFGVHTYIATYTFSPKAYAGQRIDLV